MVSKIHSVRRDLIETRAKLKVVILAHLLEVGQEKSYSLMNRLAEKYVTQDFTLMFRVTRDLKDIFESLINVGFIVKYGKGNGGTLYEITPEGMDYLATVQARYNPPEFIADYLEVVRKAVKLHHEREF